MPDYSSLADTIRQLAFLKSGGTPQVDNVSRLLGIAKGGIDIAGQLDENQKKIAETQNQQAEAQNRQGEAQFRQSEADRIKNSILGVGQKLGVPTAAQQAIKDQIFNNQQASQGPVQGPVQKINSSVDENGIPRPAQYVPPALTPLQPPVNQRDTFMKANPGIDPDLSMEDNLKKAQAQHLLAASEASPEKQGFHIFVDKTTGKELGRTPSSPGTGDTVHMVGKDDLALSEKENQFYQKQWTDLINKNDPSTANSRSTIGMLGSANLKANRAITTLSKPIVTKQEAANSMADLSSIYQGGAPTSFGMSEQQYNTAYGTVQAALQQITGKGEDTLPPDIKNRLLATLSDMKQTNTEILSNRLNVLEKTQKKVIQHYPEEWNDFKSSLLGGLAPSAKVEDLGTYLGNKDIPEGLKAKAAALKAKGWDEPSIINALKQDAGVK